MRPAYNPPSGWKAELAMHHTKRAAPDTTLTMLVTNAQRWIESLHELIALGTPWAAREARDVHARLHGVLLNLARVKLADPALDFGDDKVTAAVRSIIDRQRQQ